MFLQVAFAFKSDALRLSGITSLEANSTQESLGPHLWNSDASEIVFKHHFYWQLFPYNFSLMQLFENLN